MSENTAKKIALLATGDEITCGDILNTNGQTIAKTLFEEGMTPGVHLVTSDDEQEIESAIDYLLQHHDGLIITGGLGPTSDDRTRFALAKALNKELVFHESIWENIQERFKRFSLKNQPDSNRNQALLPEGATIIPNLNGSAAGCSIIFNNKLICMLPGPPSECLPMFHEYVKALFIQQRFQYPILQKKWLLFDVSEGEIAHELDALAEDLDLVTGYRIRYPYVETKIRTLDPVAFHTFIEKASPLLEKHLINPNSQPASDVLIEFLKTSSFVLFVDDKATRGMLAKALITVDTFEKIRFELAPAPTDLQVSISGLEDFWNPSPSLTHTSIDLSINQRSFHFQVPFRGERTLLYVVELLSKEILQHLLTPDRHRHPHSLL